MCFNNRILVVILLALFNQLCAQQQPRCRSDTCKNGGVCFTSGNKLNCNCTANFTGLNCEYAVDPCYGRGPCLNSGRCTPLSFGKFSSNFGFQSGAYSCSCNADYTGRNCKTPVNPCNQNNGAGLCLRNSTCNFLSPARYDPEKRALTPGNFSCSCMPLTLGRLCERFIYPCQYVGNAKFGKFLCQNNSTCTTLTNNTIRMNSRKKRDANFREVREFNPYFSRLILGNFVCTCAAKFTGNLCGFLADPCSSSPCKNGGTCVRLTSPTATTTGTYRCDCAPNSCSGGMLEANCRCRRPFGK
jgi:hypothetical protein